jgi:hypothetical protein
MNATPGVSPRLRPGALPRLALALVFVALAGTPLAAESSGRVVRTTSSTGLFTLHPDHSVVLSLVEAGGSAARASGVVLELLNASDAVIARAQGDLRPGQPVQLHFDGPTGSEVSFRARARLITSIENLAAAPLLTLEVFNEQTLDSFAIQTCRMKYDPKGTSGGVLGNCGGCETSFETDL